MGSTRPSLIVQKDATKPNVVVRIRWSVVQISCEHAGFRVVVPIAAAKHGARIQNERANRTGSNAHTVLVSQTSPSFVGKFHLLLITF